MPLSYSYCAVLALLSVAGRCTALLPNTQPTPLGLQETPCEACVSLISILKAYATDPTTQQKVMSFILTDVCPQLPADDRQYCAIYAPIAVAAASGWIQGRDATSICGQVQLCPTKVECVLLHQLLLLLEVTTLAAVPIDADLGRAPACFDLLPGIVPLG